MKLLIFTVFILILLYVVFYLYSSNKEGITIIGNEKNVQPEILHPVYKYDLSVAKNIWDNAGCTKGSLEPTTKNRPEWARSDWETRVNEIRQKSDKFINNEEINYNDWVGSRFKEGILQSYIKCHDKNATKDTYNFPKPGDRVKIKKDPEDVNTSYYSGIVIGNNNLDVSTLGNDFQAAINNSTFTSDTNNCLKDNKCLVLLDKKMEGGNISERISTRGNEPESSSRDIRDLIKQFGFPYFLWNRSINNTKKSDSLSTAENSWITQKSKDADAEKFGYFNSNELYVSEECKNSADCDYLNCLERKKNILVNNPLTYYCNRVTGNRQIENNLYFFCEHNNKKSTRIMYYIDREKMCSDDYEEYERIITADQNKGTDPYTRDLTSKLYFCKQDCKTGSCGYALTMAEKIEELKRRFKLVILVSNGDDAYDMSSDAKDYQGQIGFIHTNDVANNDPPTFRINATIGDLQFKRYGRLHFEIICDMMAEKKNQWSIKYTNSNGQNVKYPTGESNYKNNDDLRFTLNVNSSSQIKNLLGRYFTEIKCEYRFYEHDTYRKVRDIFYFEGIGVKVDDDGNQLIYNPNLDTNGGWNVRRRNLGRDGPQVANGTSTYPGRRGRHDDYSSYNNDGFVRDVRLGNNWRKHRDVKSNCFMRANTDDNYRGKGHDYPGPHHNLEHQGMGDKISALEFKVHNNAKLRVQNI